MLVICTLLLLVCIFYITLFLIDYYVRKKSIKKMSFSLGTQKTSTNFKKKNKKKITMGIINKIKLGNDEKIQSKIDEAGNPKFIGESINHYKISKIVIALILIIFLGDTFYHRCVWGIVGFMFPDFLLYIGAAHRKEAIIKELPKMIDYTKKSIIGGRLLHETFANLTDKLEGPLKEEVERLSARYSINLNLDENLNIFAKRLGIDEVDNFVIALSQSEKTGKVKELLTQQSELLKTKMEYQERKSSDTKSNLLPLVSVLMVTNILILVIGPLILSILTNDLFN